METVTVNKDKLRETLLKNMETHVKDFEIAWEKYQEMVIKNLEQVLKSAKNARKHTEINLHVNLSAPRNHREDYERALEMLDWELGETVELQQHEFAQLVQDDWGWKGQFASSNQYYTGSMSPSTVVAPRRRPKKVKS